MPQTKFNSTLLKIKANNYNNNNKANFQKYSLE